MFKLSSPYVRQIPSPDRYKPQGDKYFVKTRDPKVMLTAGGLLIGGEGTHDSEDARGNKEPKMFFGEIIARGDGQYSNNGEHIKPVFEVGDLVAFELGHAFSLDTLNKDYSEDNTVCYLFMAENNIYFKVEQTEADPVTIEGIYGPAIPSDSMGRSLADVESVKSGDAVKNHGATTEILLG